MESYPTAATEWPSTTIPDSIKHLIALFFMTVDDTNSTEAGNRLADEIFSEHGKMVAGSGAFEGTEQIRHCRERAWAVVKSRRHTVLKVYTSTPTADDLLLIGSVNMQLRNGRDVSQEFVARVKITDSGGERPRMGLYQVWSDSAPMSKALQEG